VEYEISLTEDVENRKGPSKITKCFVFVRSMRIEINTRARIFRRIIVRFCFGIWRLLRDSPLCRSQNECEAVAYDANKVEWWKPSRSSTSIRLAITMIEHNRLSLSVVFRTSRNDRCERVTTEWWLARYTSMFYCICGQIYWIFIYDNSYRCMHSSKLIWLRFAS